MNIHLATATISDERHGFLRRIERLGEAHVVADPFLARLGEIIVLHAAKHPGFDEAALQGFRLIVETHVMNPYAGAITTLPAAPRAIVPRRENCSLAPALLKKAVAVVQRDLARDWTVEAWAKTVGMSAGHFSRAFRGSTGASPRQWLIQQRLDAAMDKLLMTGDSLAEIAFGCGFSEQTHFTRTFSRIIGTSPGAWRRRHQR